LTTKQQEEMYLSQNGCCKLCGFPIEYSEINTDHDHKTGQVRGLLCRKCNTFIGYIETNLILLDSALVYIETGGGN
jgi:hypothetical protein